MNNEVLDIIISFIKGCKDKENRINVTTDRYYAIGNSWYLLGQIIRNYCVDINHYYISEAAVNKWNDISALPIFNFWYRNIVEMEKDKTVVIHEYVGNSKKFTERELNKGDKFVFRNVFHDEHMVPIKMILDEVLSLEVLNYDSVKDILDKIYICRLLKDEDRMLPTKYNRSTNIQDVINNDYKGIKLIKLNDWKQIFN